jgi:hypothetical protein
MAVHYFQQNRKSKAAMLMATLLDAIGIRTDIYFFGSAYIVAIPRVDMER